MNARNNSNPFSMWWVKFRFYAGNKTNQKLYSNFLFRCTNEVRSMAEIRQPGRGVRQTIVISIWNFCTQEFLHKSPSGKFIAPSINDELFPIQTTPAWRVSNQKQWVRSMAHALNLNAWYWSALELWIKIKKTLAKMSKRKFFCSIVEDDICFGTTRCFHSLTTTHCERYPDMFCVQFRNDRNVMGNKIVRQSPTN